jgi:hypothetical protein
VIVLFIVGLLKPALRLEMLEEIRGSVAIYAEVAREDHPMYSRVGPKGKHVVQAMVQVSGSERARESSAAISSLGDMLQPYPPADFAQTP